MSTKFFKNMKKVIIGSDHAGFEVKERIKKELGDQYEFVDVGTHSSESADYPQYGKAVAQQVAVTPDAQGVLVCGSGEGIMMAASKIPGVRVGLAYSIESATGMREHNNANIVSIPGRNATMDDQVDIVKTFLSTDFSGVERHEKRVEQMMDIEKNN